MLSIAAKVLDHLYVLLLLIPLTIISNFSFLLGFVVIRVGRFVGNLVVSCCCKPNASDRYVVVTGCDSGFGKEIVLELSRLNFNVFAGCFTHEGAKQYQCDYSSQATNDVNSNANGCCEMTTKVEIDADKITTFFLDIRSDESVAKAVTFVNGKLPPNKGLWAVVNNAGIGGPYIPDDWASIVDYQTLMDVNFFGAVRVTHAFKSLVKLERGRLVYMSSILGHSYTGGGAMYVAAKHALVGYCETLRLEMDDYGVKVAQIAPGFHKTQFCDAASVLKTVESRYDKLDDQQKKEYPKDTFFDKRVKSLRRLLHELTLMNRVRNVTSATVEAVVARWPESLYWVGLDAQVYFRTLSALPDDILFWQTKVNRIRLGDGHAALAAKKV